jgi:hypothetical protein
VVECSLRCPLGIDISTDHFGDVAKRRRVECQLMERGRLRYRTQRGDGKSPSLDEDCSVRKRGTARHGLGGDLGEIETAKNCGGSDHLMFKSKSVKIEGGTFGTVYNWEIHINPVSVFSANPPRMGLASLRNETRRALPKFIHSN